MKNIKLSLTTEIIINMTILLLAMIVFISILVILISKKDIYLKKAEGSLELVQVLSSLVEPIINSDISQKDETKKKEEIEQVVKKFITNLRNANIIIADSTGAVFYNSDINVKKDKVDDKNFFELLKLKTPLTIFQEKDLNFMKESPKDLFIYFPITKGDKATAGIIARFSLSKERYTTARSQSLILLSIILDAVLFIIFGSILLSRVIVKPIKKLGYATEKVASGNLDYRVESFPSKEIDSLSQSFNKMTKKLLQSQEHLKDHVNSLEQMNLELKQAKDEVLRSAKLASVGRLAAGIAHEIGNPLGSIFGYLEILKEDENADLEDYLDRVQRECRRIDIILRELLDYSRERRFNIEDVDLNEVIKDTCEALFHRKMFSDIMCKMELDEKIPDIKVDKGQIQQVITNLIINSADAMEGTGEIKLATNIVAYKEKLFSSNVLKKGDKLVRFSIHDNGSGIDQKDLDKIFDPFYTTKEPGKGTGLGLAISLRIVESFNGAMTVDSKKDKGTTFNIFLPINISPARG